MTGKPPFESVVSAHGSTVLRVCRAILGPADADDAWSETFMSALKAYPDLPDDANVEAWLVTIAHRKAIDVTRAAARRAIPVAETPETPARPGAVAAARPRVRAGAWSPTTTWPTPSPGCLPSRNRPSPTTIWPGCRTRTSPPSWAAAPRPPGAPRPTASPACAAPTRTPQGRRRPAARRTGRATGPPAPAPTSKGESR